MSNVMMFDFYTYTPHGRGWRRGMNIRAANYQAAARQIHRSTGAKRVKIEAEDAAASASMGYKTRIINFTK